MPRFTVRFLTNTPSPAPLYSQTYSAWAIASDAAADIDWLMILSPRDRLPSHALAVIANTIRSYPDAVAIYWDDDEIDAAGRRCNPRFKPDWSRLHLEATNYIGRAVAVKRTLLRQRGLDPYNEEELWQAMLILTEDPAAKVIHIPEILLHRPAGEPVPVCRRVPVSIPEPAPRVSIIVPTRDTLPLVRRCVESVLSKTTYTNYEIVLIDNRSRDPDTLLWFESQQTTKGVKLLKWVRPFNYSSINNFAARQVHSEILCLLNNDTEVITPDWLDEMVGHLVRPGVGVVGAKLYYPDGRIQHAGDTVGPGGCANHLHQYWPGDSPGYCNRAIVAQELSAVTAACMVTWRSLYLQLGGLNERWLPIAFNDVDYCLRVRRAGHKVVWTPHAELYHHESASRGKDRSWSQVIRAWREVRYMRWKWRKEMKHDPFYNPNFRYDRADFSIKDTALYSKPHS